MRPALDFIWLRPRSAIPPPSCPISKLRCLPAISRPCCFVSKTADERTLINRAKTIAAIVQRRDIAVLLDGHPEIAARAGVDGAHFTGTEALTAAIGTLKPERIAGAGGLHSRHDAMLAGESGADYVMFGEPDRRGNRAPFEAILERIRWWAEVFEPPCVGYAASPDEVAVLAQAGADFVALGDWIWTQHDSPLARSRRPPRSSRAGLARLIGQLRCRGTDRHLAHSPRQRLGDRRSRHRLRRERRSGRDGA